MFRPRLAPVSRNWTAFTRQRRPGTDATVFLQPHTRGFLPRRNVQERRGSDGDFRRNPLSRNPKERIRAKTGAEFIVDRASERGGAHPSAFHKRSSGCGSFPKVRASYDSQEWSRSKRDLLAVIPLAMLSAKCYRLDLKDGSVSLIIEAHKT